MENENSETERHETQDIIRSLARDAIAAIEREDPGAAIDALRLIEKSAGGSPEKLDIEDDIEEGSLFGGLLTLGGLFGGHNPDSAAADPVEAALLKAIAIRDARAARKIAGIETSGEQEEVYKSALDDLFNEMQRKRNQP